MTVIYYQSFSGNVEFIISPFPETCASTFLRTSLEQTPDISSEIQAIPLTPRKIISQDRFCMIGHCRRHLLNQRTSFILDRNPLGLS